MNKQQYLDRIKYTEPIEPTLEVLHALQRAHLLSVPFENLDIYYGIPIELNINRIFTKIVLNKRGGFCYELNGLFYELLTSTGFNVKRISGRVFDKEAGYGQEFDHLALIVAINGKEYLTDVGFGEFAFAPLILELNILQDDPRGQFLIDKYEDDYFRVCKKDGTELIPEYIFKNVGRQLMEYEEMCQYHQTSPESHFTQNRLISIPTQKGRWTISGNNLKMTEGHSTSEIYLETEESFKRKLSEYFGIELNQKMTTGQ